MPDPWHGCIQEWLRSDCLPLTSAAIKKLFLVALPAFLFLFAAGIYEAIADRRIVLRFPRRGVLRQKCRRAVRGGAA